MPDGAAAEAGIDKAPGAGAHDLLARFAADPAPAPQPDRERMAAALRRLSRVTVSAVLDPAALAQGAAALEDLALALALESAAVPGRLERSYVPPGPDGRLDRVLPSSPVSGAHNAIAAPVRIWVDGEAIRGEGLFDYQHEGPPTCVHGGIIAMVFDALLGAATIVVGRPAMTGTLTVRFRRPTPLHRTLTMEAHVAGVEGRRILVEGTISHEGQVTAEAQGTWVAMEPERFVGISERNTATGGDAPAGAMA